MTKNQTAITEFLGLGLAIFGIALICCLVTFGATLVLGWVFDLGLVFTSIIVTLFVTTAIQMALMPAEPEVLAPKKEDIDDEPNDDDNLGTS